MNLCISNDIASMPVFLAAYLNVNHCKGGDIVTIEDLEGLRFCEMPDAPLTIRVNDPLADFEVLFDIQGLIGSLLSFAKCDLIACSAAHRDRQQHDHSPGLSTSSTDHISIEYLWRIALRDHYRCAIDCLLLLEYRTFQTMSNCSTSETFCCCRTSHRMVH